MISVDYPITTFYSIIPINEQQQYAHIVQHSRLNSTMTIKAEDLDDVIERLSQVRDSLEKEKVATAKK
jgi:hypothetical protein